MKAKTPRKGPALFHTREAGNEGTRMPLLDPATGEKTAHWLHILSMDSDVYRKANTQAMRRVTGIEHIEAEDQKLEAHEDNGLTLVASLVTGWSFDQPETPEEDRLECTLDNVKDFLREAPQIRAAIDRASGERSFFFAGSSQDSAPGQPTISDSTGGQASPQ